MEDGQKNDRTNPAELLRARSLIRLLSRHQRTSSGVCMPISRDVCTIQYGGASQVMGNGPSSFMAAFLFEVIRWPRSGPERMAPVVHSFDRMQIACHCQSRGSGEDEIGPEEVVGAQC